MELISLLRDEHDAIRHSLVALENATYDDVERTAYLFTLVAKALRAHSALEEDVLYPRLSALPATRSLARGALRDHAHVECLLHRLERVPVDDNRWVPLFEELKEQVRAHLEEEEDRVFKRLLGSLPETDLRELSRELRHAKERGLAA